MSAGGARTDPESILHNGHEAPGAGCVPLSGAGLLPLPWQTKSRSAVNAASRPAYTERSGADAERA